MKFRVTAIAFFISDFNFHVVNWAILYFHGNVPLKCKITMTFTLNRFMLILY